jgi:hypothetical protein
MEFEIWNVDRSADKYEITKAFAEILHSAEFFDEDDPKARRMNLKIEMEESEHGYLHQGKGRLTLPTVKAGETFKRWLRVPENRVRRVTVLLIQLCISLYGSVIESIITR